MYFLLSMKNKLPTVFLVIYTGFVLFATLTRDFAVFILLAVYNLGFIKGKLPPNTGLFIATPFSPQEGAVDVFIYNLVGNIVMFVLMGVFAMYFFKQRKRAPVLSFLYCVIISICIETAQLFISYRQSDVNDII